MPMQRRKFALLGKQIQGLKVVQRAARTMEVNGLSRAFSEERHEEEHNLIRERRTLSRKHTNTCSFLHPHARSVWMQSHNFSRLLIVSANGQHLWVKPSFATRMSEEKHQTVCHWIRQIIKTYCISTPTGFYL